MFFATNCSDLGSLSNAVEPLRDSTNRTGILLQLASTLLRPQETRLRISVVAGFIPASYGGAGVGGYKTRPYKGDTRATMHPSAPGEIVIPL